MGSSVSKNKKPPVDPVVEPKRPESKITVEFKNYLSQQIKKHVTVCKGCKSPSWWGYLYHCIECPDLDICTNCFEQNLPIEGHEKNHTTIQFRNAAPPQFKSMLVNMLRGKSKIQQEDLKFIFHGEIVCQACRCSAQQHPTPLVGVRITCQECKSYNLCLVCFLRQRESQTLHDHPKMVLLQASDTVLDPDDLKGLEKIPKQTNLYKAVFKGANITIRKYDVESDKAENFKNQYSGQIRLYAQTLSFYIPIFYGSCIQIQSNKTCFYQAYEPVQNGSILDYYLTNPEISLRRRSQWGMEIINGLDKIHLKGLFHGDISPQNIFINSKLRAKIGAPGIPNDCSKFQAPDLVKDSSSDIYSFGLLLNFILTGKIHEKGEESNDIVIEYSQLWSELIQLCLQERSKRKINSQAIKNTFQKFDQKFWETFDVQTWKNLSNEDKDREFLGFHKHFHLSSIKQTTDESFQTPTPKEDSQLRQQQFFGSSPLISTIINRGIEQGEQISKSQVLQGILQQIGEKTPNSNHQIQCKVCSQSNFLDFRYKCLACQNYDLCGLCYDQKKVSHQHTNQHHVLLLLYHVSTEYIQRLKQIFTSQSRRDQQNIFINHRGISCSHCNIIQIQGIRMKCLTCKENFCLECFKDILNQHREHRFLAQVQQYIQTKSFGELEYAAKYVFPERANFLQKEVIIHSEYREQFEDELHQQIEVNCSRMIRHVGYSVESGKDQTKIISLLLQEQEDKRITNFDIQSQSYRRKFQWMLEMIIALQKIHEAGLTHKALKPSNVFIAVNNLSLYLGPFSFCSESNNDDPYQPPEVPYDLLECKSDVFQFGLMINYIFTGKEHQVIGRQYQLELSPIFGSLVKQCVRIDPRERPTSKVILEALQKFDDSFWENVQKSFCPKQVYQNKSLHEKNVIFQKIYSNLEKQLLNLKTSQ